MYKKARICPITDNQRASVAVEFCVICFMIGCLVFFMTFYSTSLSTRGKLDRLSYSLAGILRERTILYPRQERLTQSDVDDLLIVAKAMLHDMNLGGDLSNLTLKAEEIYYPMEKIPFNFPSIQLSQSQKNAVPLYITYRASKKDYKCEPPARLDTLKALSPVTPHDEKLTIYQVTICFPIDVGQTFSNIGTITSYAIAVVR